MRILAITSTASEADFSKVISYNNDNAPRLAALSFIVFDESFNILNSVPMIYVKPDSDFKRVSAKAKAYNNLSVEILREKGVEVDKVLRLVLSEVLKADLIIGANVWFTRKLLMSEFDKKMPNVNFNTLFTSTRQLDILDLSRKLVNAKYSGLKSGCRRPTLKETVKKLLGKDIEEVYDDKQAAYIVSCYKVLDKLGISKMKEDD